tara:strand:+ start:4107 stop:4451 length:345 start_codon:yes stop_codon:yes gene_type:complete
MLDTIKIYWKYILLGMCFCILILSNGIIVNRLQNDINKLQKEQVDQRRQEFNTTQRKKRVQYKKKKLELDSISKKHKKEFKNIQDELKDTTIDFTNDSLYNWVKSEYDRLDFTF